MNGNEWGRVYVSFKMAMSQILRGLHWKNMLIYVDNICVFSKDFESYLSHLEELFLRLRTAGLTLNPKKCSFVAKEVKFLGHLISKDGIQIDPNKTKVIDALPILKTVNEIRSFRECVTIIEDFSNIPQSLNLYIKLLRKYEEFSWTEE